MKPYKKRKLSDPISVESHCCVCKEHGYNIYCMYKIVAVFPRFFPLPGVFTCADRYYFLIHKPIPELIDEEYHVIASARPEFIADFRIRFPLTWGYPYNGDRKRHIIRSGLSIWSWTELQQVVATRLKICLYLKHGTCIPHDLYISIIRYIIGGEWDHCNWILEPSKKRIPIIPLIN